MANLIINQGTKFYVGDGTDVIGTSNPSGSQGISKQSNESGFYIQSSVNFTVWFYDGSSWSIHQTIDTSDANYKGGFAFAWDDNTAAYIKTADSSHVVYVFGRDGDLRVDATPGDATQLADTIVDGSGSLSITSIDAQNDYTEGLTVANDGTVTFDRTDNNAAYQLKFSGNGITIGNNGDDTITLTGADEFTTPLTTDGDLFVQAGGSDARLGIGSDGQYLSVSSGAPAWVDLSASPWTNTSSKGIHISTAGESVAIGDTATNGLSEGGKLYIKGDSSLTYALKVDREDDATALTIDSTTGIVDIDAGATIGSSDMFDIGKSYAYWVKYNPPSSMKMEWQQAGALKARILTQSGYGSFQLYNNSGVSYYKLDGVNNNYENTAQDFTFGATTSLGARVGIKGEGNTSATSSFLVQNSSSADLFEIKDDGHVIVKEGFSSGVGHTITQMSTTAAVIGGYNTFYNGVYSFIAGYGNKINSGSANQTILLGGGNQTNRAQVQLIGQSNKANYAAYGVAVGMYNELGGSSYQYAFGYDMGLTISTSWGRGTFIGHGQKPMIGIVRPSTAGVSMGNIGLGQSASNLHIAAKDNSGDGIIYIGDDGQMAVEPTVDVRDAVGLWVKDWNGAGTAGLVFKTEEGTRHFLGGSSVIGGDYNDAIDGVKLLVKGNTQIDGQVYAPYNTLTDGATITPDFNDSNNMVVTLAGNRTMANPSNLKDGASYTIIVKQDATGSRTLSFGTAFKWAGGTAPTLSTGANAVDILTFVSDGTNLYGSFVGDFQ